MSSNSSVSATRVPSRLAHFAYRAKQLLVHPAVDGYRRLVEKPADEIVNGKEIRVVGLRRTGNHAVLNWIRAQQTGEVGYLNNVAAKENPYRYKSDNLLRYHPEHANMAEVYRQQAMGNFTKRDCLIYSYEDWGLDQITSRRFERNRELYLGKSAQQFDVLILRDPFNLFASRLKQGFVTTKISSLSPVDLWLSYAKAFLGESDFLSKDAICVSYNRWFAEEDYRRDLAARLGIVFSDAGLNQVSGFGGGSSFEGANVDGRSLNVTQRWQAFATDPAFISIFKNDEVWAYSERIFGHISGTECLRA